MATQIGPLVVGDSPVLVVTAPGDLDDGETFAVRVTNDGAGVVTLGDADVESGTGRTDIDPGTTAGDDGQLTLAAGEELWAVTDGEDALVRGTAATARVRSPLETAEGGGAFDLGPEVSRTADALNGVEIVPDDLTKAFVVFLNVSVGAEGATTVQLGSYNGNTGNNRVIPASSSETLMWIGAAGESYYLGLGDATVNNMVERTLG